MLEYLLVKKKRGGVRVQRTLIFVFCVPMPTSNSAKKRVKINIPPSSIRPTSLIEGDV